MQKAQMVIQTQMQQQQQMMQQQQMAAQADQLQDPNAPAQPGQEQDQPPSVQKSESLVKQISEYETLMKANLSNLDPIAKMILDKHQSLVDKQMNAWEKDSKKAIDEIAEIMKVSAKKDE